MNALLKKIKDKTARRTVLRSLSPLMIFYLSMGGITLLVIILFNACRPVQDFPIENYDERMSGGVNTVFREGTGAFSQPFPILSGRELEVHELGDHSFEAVFVTAPALVNSGLGPVYNNVSCVSCHINDGRGKPPVGAEELQSMLIRLSIPGQNAQGGPLPIPGFGGQLQTRAVFGKKPEAKVMTQWTIIQGKYPDGTPYTLRKPTFQWTELYQPLPANYLFSPRIAQPLHGLGLLEALPEALLLELADEGDQDGDGVSGKLNYVWDAVKQRSVPGRFGWKAGQPSLLQQTAGAYHEDMGITTSIFPKENAFGPGQEDGFSDDPEVNDSILTTVAFYVSTLAVPARRNVGDPTIREGKELFVRIGCGGCHRTVLRTQTDVAQPWRSNQLIFAYTDLLLHDMGEELADGRPEFLADGREWRTPPLWGIGLTPFVNGHSNFLHDGRAESLEAAILWHGGEGLKSRERFKNLSARERQALIQFLRSL